MGQMPAIVRAVRRLSVGTALGVLLCAALLGAAVLLVAHPAAERALVRSSYTCATVEDSAARRTKLAAAVSDAAGVPRGAAGRAVDAVCVPARDGDEPYAAAVRLAEARR